MTNDRHAAALALAARGFHVFPVREGAKTPPLIHDFPTRASLAPEQIAAWWEIYPRANIGISTSRFAIAAGLLVVDVDMKGGKNGDASLFALECQGLDLPATFTQRTPSGGRHLVFVVDQVCRQGANTLGLGLDTRARGGYILGAGSTVRAGEYEVCDDRAVQMAPAWLVDRCRVQAVRGPKPASQPRVPIDSDYANRRARDYLDREAPLAVAGRGGDQVTYAVAARLKDLGVVMGEAHMLMADHWNPRCSPPWDIAELYAKVTNAYAYGTAPAGVAAPESAFANLPLPVAAPEPTSVDPITAAVRELNKTYAFVIAGGGAHVLWETQNVHGRYQLVHLCMSAFHQYHAADKLPTTGKRVEPKTHLWVEHPERRSYDGMCFLPEQSAPANFYNLWRGFAVTPLAPTETPTEEMRNACDAFFEHARANVCGDDHVLYRWLLGYFAHLVQRPFDKPLVALVFRGGKGVGKNAIVERIGALLGSHFLVTSDRRYLLGNFNGYLENCLMFVLDEAFWSGDKQAEGQLKNLITGSEHIIEHKNKEPFRVDNKTRIVVIGNEDWLIPATEDERRFAVFDVGPGRKQDLKFFERMRTGMETGGYRLLLRELLNFDLTGIDVNQAPQTKGLIDQKHSSMEPIKQWWFDCLSQGRIVGGDFDSDWPAAVECERLRAAFQRSARERNIKGRNPDTTALGGVFKRVCSIAVRTKARAGERTYYVYKLPTLAECRLAWDQYIGQKVEWPE